MVLITIVMINLSLSPLYVPGTTLNLYVYQLISSSQLPHNVSTIITCREPAYCILSAYCILHIECSTFHSIIFQDLE